MRVRVLCSDCESEMVIKIIESDYNADQMKYCPFCGVDSVSEVDDE